MLRLVRPAGAPLGLLLCFFLFSFALYVRRPRRAVGTCFQANSSFRVPSGTARRALSSEIVQTHVLRLNKISLARGRRMFLARWANKTPYGRASAA